MRERGLISVVKACVKPGGPIAAYYNNEDIKCFDLMLSSSLVVVQVRLPGRQQWLPPNNKWFASTTRLVVDNGN